MNTYRVTLVVDVKAWTLGEAAQDLYATLDRVPGELFDYSIKLLKDKDSEETV